MSDSNDKTMRDAYADGAARGYEHAYARTGKSSAPREETPRAVVFNVVADDVESVWCSSCNRSVPRAVSFETGAYANDNGITAEICIDCLLGAAAALIESASGPSAGSTGDLSDRVRQLRDRAARMGTVAGDDYIRAQGARAAVLALEADMLGRVLTDLLACGAIAALCGPSGKAAAVLTDGGGNRLLVNVLGELYVERPHATPTTERLDAQQAVGNIGLERILGGIVEALESQMPVRAPSGRLTGGRAGAAARFQRRADRLNAVIALLGKE